MNRQRDVHVYDTLIVGTGFTGIGAAIKLTQAGVDDVVIVERDQRVGGTWRDNTYPGAACDIPSLLYSFSFVANPTWSRATPPPRRSGYTSRTWWTASTCGVGSTSAPR